MIKPLSDRIVVKEYEIEVKDEVLSSGLIIPKANSENKSRHREGKVIAIGRGRLDAGRPANVPGIQNATTWTFMPMEVQVGDRVIFSFGEEYTIQGEKIHIMKEADILAVIVEDKK